MSRNKNSILAVAVIGALYATGAAAQFNITTNSGTVRYASELIKPVVLEEAIPASGDLLDNRIGFSLGYNFSDNEVRFARVECSSNLIFLSPEVDAASSNEAQYGALNGTNTPAVFFSITDPVDGVSTATANDLVIIGSANAPAAAYRLLDNNDVTCTYSLYDQPSQAQAGGAAGRIFTASGTFLRSVSSYTFATAPGQAIADVEAANGAFFSFTRDFANVVDREIGQFSIGFRDTTTANGAMVANGAAITPAILFSTATNVIAQGDTSALIGANHSATTVACADGNPFDIFNSNTNGSFRENTGTAAPLLNVPVCVLERGNTAIPEAVYTVTYDAVPSNPLVYATPDIGPLTLGQIIRNGTQLQAPLVQTPAGYISRINLTNTGAIPRTFSWTFRPASGGTPSEANTNYTGPTSGTGSIPANGSIVLSLVDVLGTAATNFNGTPPRGFFTVNVSAPNNQIQGLYQIVNPANGSISNHVMVRPGTN